MSKGRESLTTGPAGEGQETQPAGDQVEEHAGDQVEELAPPSANARKPKGHAHPEMKPPIPSSGSQRARRSPGRARHKSTRETDKGMSANGNGHAAADDQVDVEDDKLTACPLSDFKDERRKWLKLGMLPLGDLVAICGQKGSGKSVFCTAIVAHVTGTARRLPGREQRPAGVALWLTREEDPRKELRKRVAANGGDLSKVLFPGHAAKGEFKRSVFLPGDFEALELLINTTGAVVVIFDPITDFVAPGVNLDQEQPARMVLTGLQAIAHRTGCLIIVVRHPKKGTDGSLIEDMLGSAAMSAVPRVVLAVVEPAQLRPWRVVKLVVSNTFPKPRPLPFEIEDRDGEPYAVFQRELDPDDPRLNPVGRESGNPFENETVQDMMTAALTDGKWHDAKPLIEEAVRDFKTAASTVYARAAKLGVQKRLLGKGDKRRAQWRLSKDGGGGVD